MSGVLVEICLEDLAGVRLAEDAGADRIELCSALSDGGLTPSIGTVATTLRSVGRMRVNVLVRQRAGDFVFDADELAAMVADIQAVRALPNPHGVAVGFVVGALRPDGSVDVDATGLLVAACGDAPVTFHKAFDQVPDRAAALEELVGLGVARVLTSGGPASALEGADELAALVAQAGERIVVLAGGGVRPGNVAELVSRTGVREVHLRAATTAQSGTLATSQYDPGHRQVTSGAIVAAVAAAVREAAA